MDAKTDRWQIFLAYMAFVLFVASIAVYAALWSTSVAVALLFLAMAQLAGLGLGILSWPLWPARVAVIGFVVTLLVWGVELLVKRGVP